MRRAIILVHGIGDQEQRGILESFSKAVADTPGARSQVLRTPAKKDHSETFSYFYERLGREDQTFVAAEMFWSDLSSLASRFMSRLRNFFSLVANAPDIVYAALGPSSTAAGTRDHLCLRIMRSLIAFSFWMIYYPIIAYNIAYAIISFGFVAHFKYSGATVALDETFDPVALAFPAIGLAITVALSWSLGRRPASGTDAPAAKPALAYVRVLLVWINLLLLLYCVAASVLQALTSDQKLTFQDYIDPLNSILSAIWLVPFAIGALGFAGLPYFLIRFRDRWRGLLLATAITYISVRFWLALITTCWLLLATNVLRDEWRTAIVPHAEKSMRFLGLVWFDLAVFAAIFITGLVLFEWKTFRDKRIATAGTWPRLIVPSAILYVPILLAVPWIWAIAFCMCSQWACDESKCLWIDTATRTLLFHAVVLLAIGGFLIQFSGGGLKVAHDIVNYFRGDAIHREPSPIKALRDAFFFRPKPALSFRCRLRDRLLALWSDLQHVAGPFDRLDLVAHSLGTMIAIDALRDAPDAFSGPRVRLITMGSPYANIFAFYFPHMFPELRKEPPVAEFVNLYRLNDFVGTRIANEGSGIQELGGGYGSHFGYFEDQRLRDALEIAAPEAIARS